MATCFFRIFTVTCQTKFWEIGYCWGVRHGACCKGGLNPYVDQGASCACQMYARLTGGRDPLLLLHASVLAHGFQCRSAVRIRSSFFPPPESQEYRTGEIHTRIKGVCRTYGRSRQKSSPPQVAGRKPGGCRLGGNGDGPSPLRGAAIWCQIFPQPTHHRNFPREATAEL